MKKARNRLYLLIAGLLTLVVAAGCTSAPDAEEAAEAASPYAGEQDRAIKALSQQEIDEYLAGEGMGLAKAAELNQYPGPKHVLALADALGLDESQRARTQRLFDTMQADAITLGRKVVDKERELDALFAEQQADEAAVRAVLHDLGALQADLRLVHLQAHLAMKDLLTAEQVAHYDQLRGYDASAPPGQHLHDGDHQH